MEAAVSTVPARIGTTFILAKQISYLEMRREKGTIDLLAQSWWPRDLSAPQDPCRAQLQPFMYPLVGPVSTCSIAPHPARYLNFCFGSPSHHRCPHILRNVLHQWRQLSALEVRLGRRTLKPSSQAFGHSRFLEHAPHAPQS
jgi:hypothetical protein